MELDVWIPSLNLAFEFQGRIFIENFLKTAKGNHHYRHFFNNTSNQRQRDESKKIACLQAGISLIEVPYWWNGKDGKCTLQWNLHTRIAGCNNYTTQTRLAKTF